MPHPREHDVYPIGSTILFTSRFNKGKKGLILEHARFKDGKFQHYVVSVENRVGRFAVYHDDIEVIKK